MAPQDASGGSLLLLGAIIVATLLFLGVIAGFLRRPGDAAERARLFEMGYYLPRRASRWPQSLFCTAMGLGVPIAALSFAAATTESGPWHENWIVACVISGVAIVGATIVAAIVFSRPEPSGQPEKLVTDAKPAIDPDALDFAGRLSRN